MSRLWSQSLFKSIQTPWKLLGFYWSKHGFGPNFEFCRNTPFTCPLGDHSVYVPSQWETALQCNGVSHWLGAYIEWSLRLHILSVNIWGLVVSQCKNMYNEFYIIHAIAWQWCHIKLYLPILRSLRPADTWKQHWTETSLVQVMAGHLFNIKPLPKPMLNNCQLGHCEIEIERQKNSLKIRT